MPSRKSNSSETQPECRRSSLRRLSSIASFQTLFHRRKGTQATDNTAASSSSNLSLSLSCTTDDASGPSTRATAHLQHEDSIAELPASSPPASRLSPTKGSYVCLPDDPIGGMPRSRTFSNLPVPVRTRRASNLSQSQSYARLPAFPTSTRLPSPATSTLIHSHGRLASVESKVPIMRNRVKRSDTEPLLPPTFQQGNSFGRSTAFKENITLSPVKPPPVMDVSAPYGHSGIAVGNTAHRLRRESTDEGGIREPSAFGYVYAGHPAVQMAREHRSSPAYKGVPQIKPFQGAGIPQPVQRWNSQPILTNVTNTHRASLYGEIKQTRLMSARQAPTPPLLRTPLAWEGPRFGRAKSTSFSSSKLLPPPEEAEDVHHPITKSVNASSRPSTLSISCAEPSAYWAGRLCALTDRYRNEELAEQIIACSARTSSGLTPKGQTDKMHTPEATTARNKRALDHLTELCVTSEARESLLQFQAAYARQLGQPDLAPPKPPTRRIVLGSLKDDLGEAVGDGDKSASDSRKTSFMDRLLGRQKRRSLVPSGS